MSGSDGAAAGSAPVDDATRDREVLDAAELAMSRVMSGVAEQAERMPPDLEPADALRWAGDRLTELVAGFAELPLDRLLSLAKPATDTGARHEDRHDQLPTGGEPLTVPATAGELAEARIWVHLVGDAHPAGPAGPLQFSLGDLTGPDGAPWPPAEVIFSPDTCVLPISAPWSTVLRLRVPQHAVPGSHHGLVIARGPIAAVVPITLVVT